MGRLKALQGVLAGSVATAVLAFGTTVPGGARLDGWR